MDTLRIPLRAAAVAAMVASAAACGKEADAAGGPGGGRPGGGGPSVTLAATDLASPRRMALEDAIAVTGNLEPLERAEVRSRLEGDVEGVYVREGEVVSAGQLLARFDAGDQAGNARSADADVAAARSELETASWTLEQNRELHREGAIPERDVRVAEQAVAAARARLAAAQARSGSSRREVGDTRVVAPSSGTIERRMVNPGEHVNRNVALFTLVRGDVLELAAAVPERAAAGVQPGQTVRFTADGAQFTGRVARISPSVDPGSRSVTIYVQVPNPDGRLRAGTFASGRIVSRVLDDAMVVPLAALREGGQGGQPVVYRVADGKIDVANVTVGLRDETNGLVEITDGLSEGDQVVVGNVGILGKGMSVRMAGQGGAEKGGAGAQKGGR
ncbi:efflux RND transporter periplasmic adaptor subunit [Longimicrobium sp.]|uniref:efflux RND transporter periplasmic adaptor subunit n=1 Tax=Longimicrobium sp. TaxID=2029185 RepID=UPI002E2FE555|nr:efflux RND transporter periplasmic adaptor subunit [Longimicrobium sp.]HEX6036997.1 efflux RND transporter periplasmic adaptor subunit [Longimicrobium sp.]